MALPSRSRRAAGRDPLVMLVTSSGGHLSHLLELQGFWEAHRRVWVSFELPDAVSRLEGEDVVWAHQPTTRNVGNLLRNLALAWSELRRRRPELIVSTGAGVAVPFFWLGRLMGARTVFLEVYDRIDSATMTGRLVRRFADAMLVQWPEQAGLYPKTQVMGPIWPDRLTERTDDRELEVPSGERVAASSASTLPLVVVTVGTDFHPFARLVNWAARWADDHIDDAQVVIQFGTADDPGGVATREGSLASFELLAYMGQADAVVCAAGPGTVIDALRAGVQPVVVPRRSELGEHVDDHQVAFARLLEQRGVTWGATTEGELRAHLDRVINNPKCCAVTPLGTGTTPGASNVSRLLEEMMR